MREILFRGKRIDNGEWVEGCYISSCEGTFIQTNCIEHYYVPAVSCKKVVPETLCQFTGLCDKNGNKIWENDILRYEWDGKTRIDIVKYQPPIFTYSNSMRWSLNQDEVIGNIFDNPELLQEVSE